MEDILSSKSCKQFDFTVLLRQSHKVKQQCAI